MVVDAAFALVAVAAAVAGERRPARRARRPTAARHPVPVPRRDRNLAGVPRVHVAPQDHGRGPGGREREHGRAGPRSKGIAFTNWLVNKTAGLLEKKSSRRGFLIGSAMVGSAVAVAGVRARHATRFAVQPHHRLRGRPLHRRLHRVLLHDQQRPQRVPARQLRRWLVARRLLQLLQRHPLLHRLHAELLRRPNLGERLLRRAASSARCGGGCDTRRVYCNYFRYGQCHQRSASPGPIACRVVTCTPPYADARWRAPPTLAVDNSTAEHAPAHGCTPPPPPFVSAAVLPSTAQPSRRPRATRRSFAAPIADYTRQLRASTLGARGTDGSIAAGDQLRLCRRSTIDRISTCSGAAPTTASGTSAKRHGRLVRVEQILHGQRGAPIRRRAPTPQAFTSSCAGSTTAIWLTSDVTGALDGLHEPRWRLDSDPAAVADTSGVYVFVRGA